ncbi:MAG: hypothetical protein GF309_11375 [Candidatus Lokiarchaeota archaeon]|nr:hypothetical protein [Candidatus Lokiarchaeota archaeon]
MPTDLEEVFGVSAKTAAKLRKIGITSAEMLSYQDPNDIRFYRRYQIRNIDEFIKAARKMLSSSNLRPATEVEREMSKKQQLTTGISMIDTRLQGGIYTGSLVEFYGPAASGKSQWCHQLAVTSQLPTERGGLDGKAIWIDAEWSFSPLLIRVMAKRFDLDSYKVMQHIETIHIMNREHIVEFRDALSTGCTEEVSVVVVDALGKLFAMELARGYDHDICSAELNKTLERFQDIALTSGIIFVYTNRVHRGREHHNSVLTTLPVNGKYMAHMAHYRFKLKKPMSYRSNFCLEDHVSIPSFNVELPLEWGGFYHHPNTVQISALREYAESYINGPSD